MTVPNRIIILGGYGNFGRYIAQAMCKAHIPIILVGRHEEAANAFKQTLLGSFPGAEIKVCILDINVSLTKALHELKPLVVINTCGPFQLANYDVAEACIDAGVHYIDLADARDFVCGITQLDAKAKAKNVLVVSGASSVPSLSSAVVTHFQSEFKEIDSLNYGIATVQRFSRGFATAKGLLTYIGKRCRSPMGENSPFYGWQGLHYVKYPGLGRRWMGRCDTPDLDLFPQHYGIKKMQFYAGMESSFLHLSMWFVSWLVRLGLPVSLPKHTQFLLNVAKRFDWQTTDNSGMHIFIKGKDHAGKPLEIQWYILAEKATGPYIPTAPAIILAKQLVSQSLTLRGATPCINLIPLETYLAALDGLPIKTITYRED